MLHRPDFPRKSLKNCAYSISILAAAMLFASAVGGAFDPARAQSNDGSNNLLDAVVGIDTHIPSNARTAGTLGTERQGSGAVISDDGLVLTIGYLILEANSIDLTTSDGRTIPAKFLGYDHASGFGLVRALSPLGVTPFELGSSDDAAARSQALIANRLGKESVQGVFVVDRRQFVGSWEYLLDDAIYTSPPNPNFSGASLLGADGRLLGIGSLFVGNAAVIQQPVPGNMFVPIDELRPILDDMVASGRRAGNARPWVGIFSSEFRGRVFVDRIAPDGPAEAAGIEPGDLIVNVRGTPVDDMASFLRAVWKDGKAGDKIDMTVLTKGGELRGVSVSSDDRQNWLRLDPSF
ncbi:MAG: PDZ domain-containing protein [Alphaproteobacteria bacterium]|nr:PDZ domain-containing protein [Alphaproteobacteria bacterium]